MSHSQLSFHSICYFLSCDTRSLVQNFFFPRDFIHLIFTRISFKAHKYTCPRFSFAMKVPLKQGNELQCKKLCEGDLGLLVLFLSSQQRPRERLQGALKVCTLLSVLQDWALIWQWHICWSCSASSQSTTQHHLLSARQPVSLLPPLTCGIMKSEWEDKQFLD